MNADEVSESPPRTTAVRAPVRDERASDSILLGSPREVLARIVPGDPLELRRRAALRLRERALLLDSERVLLRALALVAYRAGAWRGRPELERWLAARIDEAIESVLDGDGVSCGPGAPDPAAPAPHRDAFALLAAPLGLEARELRGACARFNRLSPSEREAFFLLVIEGESLDAACAKRAVPASELARAARRALEVLRDPGTGPVPFSRERSPSP